RVYVFENQWYALVTERLAREGRAWREISVPIALRRPAASGGDGWSDGFLDLLARPLDRDAFRNGLARLLGGAAGGGAGGVGGVARPTGPFASTPPPAQESLLERIAKRLRIWMAFAAVALGFGAVIATEWLVPRIRVRPVRERRFVP